jgi:ABC-type polysaccharide/polyol phosphate export permease
MTMGGSGAGLLLAKNWLVYSLYFLKQDLSKQFDRSVLGYGWLLIHQAVTILGIALVYSAILRIELSGFLPYLSISILTWNLLSGVITEAPRTYHAAGPILRSFRIPSATFALKMTLRHFVLFVYGLPIHILVLLFFAKDPFPAVLLTVVHLPALFALLYALANVLGLLGARFRDLAPAMTSLLYVVFLVSPVIYEPSSLPERAHAILYLNPFYYLLEFVRRPFLGEVPSWQVYGSMLAFTIAAWSLATWMNRRYGRYIVFWL